jgi:ABC-type Mn2+/Zn2+ transport system ATPase subunit
MNTPLLTIENLEVGYRGRSILPAFSMKVCAGEQWAIIGPNGGGKSTFVRTVLGLQAPVIGVCIWASLCKLSYIAQRTREDLSFPISVREYVSGGVERGLSFLNPLVPFSSETRQAVDQALHDTDTGNMARMQLAELSEGQLQRAKIARALASEPHVLVLDEPTSAMDANRQDSVFALLASLAERGMTTLTVSHHMLAIGNAASHVLLLDKDQGLVLSGPTDEILQSDAYQNLYGWLHHRGGAAP